jgi:hypothetical protein
MGSDYYATFLTLPDLKQRVHTSALRTLPFKSILTG